jgi:hypothetical protein
MLRALVLSGQGQGRNADQTRRGVKRAPWFGKPNAAKASILADILTCALNVVRFIWEATVAAVRSIISTGT